MKVIHLSPALPLPLPTLFGYTLMLFLKGLYHPYPPPPNILYNVCQNMNQFANKQTQMNNTKMKNEITYESRLHWHKKP